MKRSEYEIPVSEVLASVTLADVWKLAKDSLVQFLAVAIFLGISALVMNALGIGSKDGADNGSWSNWGASALVILLLVHLGAGQRHFHAWRGWFYFPKLGWLGQLLLTAYFLSAAWLFLWVTNEVAGQLPRIAAYLALYFVYLLPPAMLLDLMQKGYRRVAEERGLSLPPK